MGKILQDRLGEENYNKQGYLMKIIQYNSALNIIVEFQDEYKAKICSIYDSFINGSINNPNYRLGENHYNNQDCLMKIIEYNNCDDITIEFQDKYKAKVHSAYKCFKNGEIRNPYHKSVYGVGYIGIGNYTSKINGKITIQYTTWSNMLQRCYDKKFHEKHPTYKDCTICEKWHDFQNFALWFDENYYSVEGERMCLDKDILIKKNKIYNSETCVFVPQRINKLFTKGDKIRGEYPIGVYKEKNKFKTQINYDSIQQTYLGSHNTPEEAFQAYKIAKEEYIKQIADEYKNKIPQRLYDAMYKYEVEIDD